jgi:hypothetical protein
MRTARPFTHEWLCLSDTQLYNSQIRITKGGGNEGEKGESIIISQIKFIRAFRIRHIAIIIIIHRGAKVFLGRQGTVVQGQRLLFMTYSRILSGMQAF